MGFRTCYLAHPEAKQPEAALQFQPMDVSRTQLKGIENIIEVHYEEFRRAWQEHLSS
jgi:hypothetical protein